MKVKFKSRGESKQADVERHVCVRWPGADWPLVHGTDVLDCDEKMKQMGFTEIEWVEDE